MEIWEVVIICLLALFIGIAIIMLTDGKEKLRRKKHPVWYKHYGRALKNSLWVGSRFRQTTETLKARREMVMDMFFKGECTEDEYDDAMKSINKQYKEAAKQFSIDEEAYGINDDLKEADTYAKEHNLKWGILYD